MTHERTLARRRTAALWAGIALMSLMALLGSGCGAGSGASLGVIALGTDVVLADVDADGRTDVILLAHLFGEGPSEGRLTVHRQTAAGRFEAAETSAVGCYPWSMTLADVDGDGRADVVVTDVGSWNCSDPSAGDALYLLRQDPARPGRFLPAEKIAGDVHGYQAAVADLNGDGAPDIAFGRRAAGSDRLVVLYQEPLQRGRFAAPVETVAPGAVSEIAGGDIDGDGRPDLFFVAYGPSTGYTPETWLALVLQRADGTLGAPTLLTSQTGVNVQHLAILDLDGDGRKDLLAHFTPFSTDFQPYLRALRQGATPLAWSAPIDGALDGILGVDGTAMGDLDQDGRPDVVLAGSWPESGGPLAAPQIRSRVNLLFGLGDGRFGYVGGIDVEPQPDSVAIGDIDGDGRNDIVLNDGRIAWWLRQSSVAPGVFAAPVPVR